jgi:hypothetical protein
VGRGADKLSQGPAITLKEMNKSIVKYLLVLIVAGILLFFMFKGRMPFGKGNTSFAVESSTEITRIDFYQGDKKLTLEKSGDRWFINKKEEARKNAISFILRTLREMKIKSPVSPEIFENEIIKKQVDPIKVNIYERRRLSRSFFVYKTGSNIYGNIMKMRASSKPYIVYIPGFEDNISTHFIMNELFWKPYLVFNLLPSRIESIRFESFTDTSSSFLINCRKKAYSLSDGIKYIAGWDTLKIKRYLSYYTAISFDSWAFDLSETEKKSIESAIPIYRITVKPLDGKEISLTIWEKWISVNGEKKRDTDRVWAKTNLQDGIFEMRYFDLDPILKKRTYFFPE